MCVLKSKYVYTDLQISIIATYRYIFGHRCIDKNNKKTLCL